MIRFPAPGVSRASVFFGSSGVHSAVASRPRGLRFRHAAALPFVIALGAGLAACGSSDDGSMPSAGSGGAAAGGSSAGSAGNAGVGAGGTPVTGGGSPDAGLPPGVGACNVRIVESPPTSAIHQAECSDIAYSTNPPSGGDHYQFWAAFQSYDTPVRPGFLVHALEHGAVVFWYDCPEGCADEVEGVEDFIAGLPEDPLCTSVPRRTVLVPYPELASRWAASAWGFALTADCFDADVFRAFYSDHVGNAPEQLCGNGQTTVATRCP
jgi:hypothetical protein